MNKPFLTYNGGKEADGTYQKIINIMPPHDIYIEPFLGNGAILRKKKPAHYSIAIDLDTSVIQKWQKINLPGCNFINTDAISWLKHFSPMATIFKKLGTSVFIYIDPPYPMSSRKSKVDRYTHEMTDTNHTELLEVVRGINANILISSYPNQLYNDFLQNWNFLTFQSSTRSGTATEKVWFNYDAPAQLHDYKFLGDNFRERERIKGIISRGVTKFKRMTAIERNALIQQLQNKNLI